MPEIIVWEVDLEVYGAVKIDKPISIVSRKGFDLDQFYSNIKINNTSNGFRANVNAYAPDCKLAREVALVYFSKMLDVLSFKIEIPLELVYWGKKGRSRNDFETRRILDSTIIEESFEVARILEYGYGGGLSEIIENPDLMRRNAQPSLLNALSWYQKGNIALNPLDRFVSYWTAIEILGTKYYTETERTISQNGESKTINKIYQCFIDRYGEVDSWELPERWIDRTYIHRNKVVHGGIPINYETMQTIELIMEETRTECKKLISKIYDEQNL